MNCAWALVPTTNSNPAIRAPNPPSRSARPSHMVPANITSSITTVGDGRVRRERGARAAQISSPSEFGLRAVRSPQRNADLDLAQLQKVVQNDRSNRDPPLLGSTAHER